MVRAGCVIALAAGALLLPLSAVSFGASPNVAGGGCVDNSNCDDGLACTDDVCAVNICTHTPILGCVACEPTFDCVPVDLVFIMDTSGSMRDEAIALCGQIADVVTQLEAIGATVTPTVLGITNSGDISFTCLENDVVSKLGPSVPGALDTCVFPGGSSSFESWGPATAIVAARFPWKPGSTKLIVPLADEGPCNGSRPDGCNDPGDDRDSVTNAGVVAAANGVIVSPVTGTGSDSCVTTLADALAAATGGTAVRTSDAALDMAAAITQIVLATCVPNLGCDDGSVCTDQDTCVGGVCTGTPNYDPVTSCCDPLLGGVVSIDDGNSCTDDLCDVATGTVTHPPSDTNVACHDGNICTANDTCDGAGGCAGIDINTIACNSQTDCFGAACDTNAGHCVCTSTPTLCLNALTPSPTQSCFTSGDTVTFDIELGFSTNVIAGTDLFFHYDPAVLAFQSIIPGSYVDGTSPYELELFREINEIAGTVFYSVGINLGGSGSQGPTTLARVQFTALGACQSDQLCWLDGNPKRTTLSDMSGQVVPFEPCCSLEFFINSSASTITCPDSALLRADPGSSGPTLTWNAPTASSDCQGAIGVSCTATHSTGLDINHLIDGGGLFPVGTSEFACTAVDTCGASNSCSWTIEVDEMTLVEVDLELSPAMNSGQDGTTLDRCIEFELYSNCLEAPFVVSQTVHFGPPFNLQGHADGVLFEVPPGDYQCISARDPLHTVRSVSSLSVVNGRFYASFSGDPFFGGNWLVSGNLDGNNTIDVLDFGIFVDYFFSAQDADTPCGTAGVNADFNGDAFVDTRDWQFISNHIDTTDMVSCCGTTAGTTPHSVLEISVDELSARGMARLRIADLNQDGWLDQADIELFRTEGFSRKAAGKRPRGIRGR